MSKRLYHRLEGFNTQPPEGGWVIRNSDTYACKSFNTQPPEGGWKTGVYKGFSIGGFNTQPPEGGWLDSFFLHILGKVSTHSRLKAAGFHVVTSTFPKEGFNTQPPEGGWAR